MATGAWPFYTDVDFRTHQALGFVLERLSSDPTSVDARLYFNTTTNRIRFYNGEEWVNIGDSSSVEGITAVVAAEGSPITANTTTNTVTIDISEATTSVKGAMSATDKAKLDAATNSNTASTIVMRDSSGNFSAGTITASLTGTASNASQLNSQNASYYLDRANHTGTQTASTISDLSTVVQAYTLDSFATPTSDISMGGNKITNLAAPVNDNDAVTKAYVDANSSGLDAKESVRAATTEDITLTDEQTIDGVELVDGDRVLVKNQEDATENGIYIVVDDDTWVRAPDADSESNVTTGMFTFVEEGETHGGEGWVLITPGPLELGTSELQFTRFSSQGVISAGDGLDKTGNTLSVVGTAGRISVGAGGVDIDATYVGQTSITTLGTITTGTWNGTAIGVAYGGTGLTSLTTGSFLRAASASTFEQLTAEEVLDAIGAVEANEAITGGTATKITYDAKGLVTGGTTLVASDIPSLSADKITSGTFSLDRIPTISVAKGGTGLTSVTTNSYLKGNGTGNLIERTYAEVKTDLSLNNVENVAISTWTGSSNVTTLGTIGTGVWEGTEIAIEHGGTGATSAAEARSNLGAIGRYTTTIGDGEESNFVITHNLGTRNVWVAIRETNSPYSLVYAGVEITSTNTVTVYFAEVPTTNQYTVIVLG
jgi:hypothetical protein